jgi:hypothetical protein
MHVCNCSGAHRKDDCVPKEGGNRPISAHNNGRLRYGVAQFPVELTSGLSGPGEGGEVWLDPILACARGGQGGGAVMRAEQALV